MSLVEQFTYTASPWGRSDSGWMIFQKSSGIDDSEVGKISSYYRYERPYGWEGAPDDSLLSRYPIQFVFAKPKAFNGDTLLIQTTFTGQRWYDPRPGDWFAHGFRIDHAALLSKIKTIESPFRWFNSASIQREYPRGLREKASLISQRKIPWETPPVLPSLDSFDEIESNLDFEWESILDRMSDEVLPKLGVLLAYIIKHYNATNKRTDGHKALVFDATKSECLNTMASLLELTPLRFRIEVQFATYFNAENVRETNADETFLFYGTVREGETSDPDTGLYGELPKDGPEFKSREEVELFKRMVDAGGMEFGANDFDNLVTCWEVATGRNRLPDAMRGVNDFCNKFPDVRGVMLDKLREWLLDEVDCDNPEWIRNFTAVRYILNADLEYEANDFNDKCISDSDIFRVAFTCLQSDANNKNDELSQKTHRKGVKKSVSQKNNLSNLQCNFLHDLEIYVTDDNEKKSTFANTLISFGIDSYNCGCLPFVGLVSKYCEIIKSMNKPCINEGCNKLDDKDNKVEHNLFNIRKLRDEVGNGFLELDDVLERLEYQSAIGKIHTISDIPRCLRLPLPERMRMNHEKARKDIAPANFQCNTRCISNADSAFL